MKIIIKSSQIFENHVDNVEEIYECDINYFENGFELAYDGANIKLIDNVLSVNKENMCLTIEKENVNSANINTPYGRLDLTVKGEKINWQKEPFLLEVRYTIKIGNTSEYINELQMMFAEE